MKPFTTLQPWKKLRTKTKMRCKRKARIERQECSLAVLILSKPLTKLDQIFMILSGIPEKEYASKTISRHDAIDYMQVVRLLI